MTSVPDLPVPDLPLDRLSDSDLAALICRATDELSTRSSRDAFIEMLRIVAYVSERVGDSARSMASANSWSQVAEISGTSRQAAWQRWRMS